MGPMDEKGSKISELLLSYTNNDHELAIVSTTFGAQNNRISHIIKCDGLKRVDDILAR